MKPTKPITPNLVPTPEANVPMNVVSKGPDVHRTVSLDGKPWTEGVVRNLFAVLLVVLGVFLWYGSGGFRAIGAAPVGSPESEGLQVTLAILAFIGAACLPYNAHTYLDLTDKQVIVATHYAGVPVRRRCRSFDAFSAIVVRHLCHSGEGEESYTGSIGLKPADGGKILWTKGYPTNADEIPPAARAFAMELQAMTGLPLHDSLAGWNPPGNVRSGADRP